MLIDSLCIKDDWSFKVCVVTVHYFTLCVQIQGLPEALEDPTSGIASNFSPKYVTKTFELIKNFKGGNAIFTMPTLPIKCPGAPQKIMYLAEDYFCKVNT